MPQNHQSKIVISALGRRWGKSVQTTMVHSAIVAEMAGMTDEEKCLFLQSIMVAFGMPGNDEDAEEKVREIVVDEW